MPAPDITHRDDSTPRPWRCWLRYVLVAVLITAIGFLFLPKRLTLIVSNHSPDVNPVDMQVVVDGQTVIDKNFEFGTGRYYRAFAMPLWLGPHSISVNSEKRGIRAHSDFHVFWNRWVIIDYWSFPDYREERGKEPDNHISIEIMSHQPMWD